MMRTTKYILVTIGVLGMMASVYMGIVHKEVLPNVSSFIISLSLVYFWLYKEVSPETIKCPVEVEKTKDSF